jgi:hypothetical protein
MSRARRTATSGSAGNDRQPTRPVRTAPPAGWATTRCWRPVPTPGEILHTDAARSANTARGAQRFVRETIGRVRRAGATGHLTLRADWGSGRPRSSPHANTTMPAIPSPSAIPTPVVEAIETAWIDIAYPNGGRAQTAETPTRPTPDRAPHPADRQPGAAVPRLASPRVRHRPHGTAVDLDADHRHHAVCELAIRDLKHGAGLVHCPSVVEEDVDAVRHSSRSRDEIRSVR